MAELKATVKCPTCGAELDLTELEYSVVFKPKSKPTEKTPDTTGIPHPTDTTTST